MESLSAAHAEIQVVAIKNYVLILDKNIQGSKQLKLAGILIPQTPPGLARRVHDFLENLVLNVPIEISYGYLERHGRLVAQVYLRNGTWVQEEILKHGLARVLPPLNDRNQAMEMLALEAKARTARRGLWRLKTYTVQPSNNIRSSPGSYQLIEGRIQAAGKIRRHVYLNFGPNWRTDFTVILKPAAQRLFFKEALDPTTLQNAYVRVRGWLQTYNGPMIEVDHPQQIEILDKFSNKR